MGREEKSVLGNNASVIIELKGSLCDEMQSCCLELYLRAALGVSYYFTARLFPKNVQIFK